MQFVRSLRPPVSVNKKKSNADFRIFAGVALTAVAVSALFYVAKKMKVEDHPSSPWAIEPHPYLGHIPFFKKNYHRMHDALTETLNKHPSPITCFILKGNFHHYINSPELAKWVFTDEEASFGKTAESAKDWEVVFGKFGDGIFTSNGAQWRFHRKIATRMFSVRNVRDYMYGCCVTTVRNTMTKINELICDPQLNSIIDVNDILGRMTFDCFTTIAYGVSFDSMSSYPKPDPFGQAFDGLMREIMRRYTDLIGPIRRAFNLGYEKRISEYAATMNSFSQSILKTRADKGKRNLSDESGSEHFDLLSLYTSFDPKISNTQLKTIAVHFMIAGRDTTKMMLSWFIYDMCMMPQIRERLYEEIDAIRDSDLSEHGQPSYRLVSRFANGLQYLECCLCESSRYHPVVPFPRRPASKDMVIPDRVLFPDGKKPENAPDQYVIRKGELVTLHRPTSARNERFFKDPDTYNPERYMSKGVRSFPTNVFTFFSARPRMCLGRDLAFIEAKIFVCNFFKAYRFEMVTGQTIVSSPGTVLNMSNGLKVKLTPRN